MPDSRQKDWRELCIAVTNESDSAKLSPLVEELIEALERANKVGIQKCELSPSPVDPGNHGWRWGGEGSDGTSAEPPPTTVSPYQRNRT